jgi:uncharacterized protein YecE (DUF72 family)
MSLFRSSEEAHELPSQAARLGPKLRALAERGVYFGTSSWKYEGWLGSIYSSERYQTRGKFSKKKFEAECLVEYAETFPAVCGDFAFYQFPTADYWRGLFEATPPSLVFGLKVPETITVARWPSHARYGSKAGEENPSFLDTALFRSQFTRLLEPCAGRVAVLIFEFGTFAKAVFPDVNHFLYRLDDFLGALPRGFRYAVEIRNPEYLEPGYFACLSGHGVAHVLSAWTRMPELGSQLDRPGVETADFFVVRALLSKGRTYEKAVEAFEPYERTREPNEAAREAMRRVAERAMEEQKRAFVFVNNRLEGNAPTTIEAVADGIGASSLRAEG